MKTILLVFHFESVDFVVSSFKKRSKWWLTATAMNIYAYKKRKDNARYINHD